MCFRLLELLSPAPFFPAVLDNIGIPGSCFQTIQKLTGACRTNTETQLTVPGVQEGGDKRFTGVEQWSLLLWLLMFSVWERRVLSPVDPFYGTVLLLMNMGAQKCLFGLCHQLKEP